MVAGLGQGRRRDWRRPPEETSSLVVCRVDGQPVPLTVGFIAYTGCHHVVCERCAGPKEWRSKPEPKRCKPCRVAPSQAAR